MLKKILIIVAIVFATNYVNAQAFFKKGDVGLNLGLLIGNDTYYTTSPGINSSIEWGLYPVGDGFGIVSLGAGLDVLFYSSDYTFIRPSFRAAFHLSILNTEKFDVYGGLMSGFTSGYYSNYLFLDDFVGGRMMLKDNLGIYAEFGFISATNFRAGVFFML